MGPFLCANQFIVERITVMNELKLSGESGSVKQSG